MSVFRLDAGGLTLGVGTARFALRLRLCRCSILSVPETRSLAQPLHFCDDTIWKRLCALAVGPGGGTYATSDGYCSRADIESLIRPGKDWANR